MNTNPMSEPVIFTPADTLRAAAAYIGRHGWTQDDYYDNTSQNPDFPAACALGAIGMAVHGVPLNNPQDPDLSGAERFHAANAALRDYLDGQIWLSASDEPLTVDVWNDLADQTKADVIATLNDAADRWQHSHGGAA